MMVERSEAAPERVSMSDLEHVIDVDELMACGIEWCREFGFVEADEEASHD